MARLKIGPKARPTRADRAASYTAWGIRYPWHVSDTPYPKDRAGNCTCQCIYCRKRGKHLASRAAHLTSGR